MKIKVGSVRISPYSLGILVDPLFGIDLSDSQGVHDRHGPWSDKSKLVKELLSLPFVESVRIAADSPIIVYFAQMADLSDKRYRENVYDAIIYVFSPDRPAEWTEVVAGELEPNLSARFRGPNDDLDDG